MKTILAIVAIFAIPAARADIDSFSISNTQADAWIYHASPDKWHLADEMQLSFTVCLKDNLKQAAKKKRFRVEDGENNNVISEEIYDTSDSGCFIWFEKFPLIPFAKIDRPVKLLRNIRALGDFGGSSALAEFVVDPDPSKPAVQNLALVVAPRGVISESEYKSQSLQAAPAAVFAKKIVLTMNWQTNTIEIMVDLEPLVMTLGSDGLPYYRDITAGAFAVDLNLITENVGPLPDWMKPVAESSTSVAPVDHGHLLKTMTVHLSTEGLPSNANYFLSIKLTPKGYDGRPPVSSSELVCAMGIGLGFANPIHDCLLHPSCLEGTDQCTLPKTINKR
jgi:hypothetical protein